MSNVKKLQVADLLGYKLKKTQHALRLAMDNALKELELTTPQYSVLAQLESCGKMSNAELARRSFIKPQTMHGIISNLEKRNLVKRTKCPNHGRILSAEITSEGKKVTQKAHDLISNIESQMTVNISQENKALLLYLLSTCFNNLKGINLLGSSNKTNK